MSLVREAWAARIEGRTAAYTPAAMHVYWDDPGTGEHVQEDYCLDHGFEVLADKQATPYYRNVGYFLHEKGIDPGSLCVVCAGGKHSTEFLTSWVMSLTKLTEGLDLGDSDDRAIFRTHVDDAFSMASLDGINEVAEGLGKPRSNSRSQATRNVADALMAEHTAKLAVFTPAAAHIEWHDPSGDRKGGFTNLCMDHYPPFVIDKRKAGFEVTVEPHMMGTDSPCRMCRDMDAP